MTHPTPSSEIERAQAERRDAFISALDDFIARINHIDAETPGDSDFPPPWWLKLSEIRSATIKTRMSIAGIKPNSGY